MLKLTRLAAGLLLATSILLMPPAFAQFATGYPDPELIANAEKFQPPTLAEYAKDFVTRPDMTGLWTSMVPKGAGVGPTFDPVNTFWPPQPLPGEAMFGPVPGTYNMGVPYNAEYAALYKRYLAEIQQGKSRDKFAACFPYGVPRMIGDSPVPFDIIQSPEVMFWYNDYGRTERRIFLDGRKHPSEPTSTGGFGPSYSGHSTGHWEDNTLVVETVDMIAGNYDETAAPYSDQLKMVERMRLIDTNILEIEMTFTDSVAFTQPWVVTRYFKRGSPFARSAVTDPATGKKPITRGAFINLNDRPCIPNVTLDEDGFQVTVLPAEAEAAAAAAAKAAKKKKKR